MKAGHRSRPPSRPESARQQTAKAGSGTTRETFSSFVRNLAKLENDRNRMAKREANRG